MRAAAKADRRRSLARGALSAVSYHVTTQLAVIPLTGGSIGEGGRLFSVYCAACHRTAVRGGVLTFAGRNAPALTDKSAALIAGAIRWGPGTMPSFPEPVMILAGQRPHLLRLGDIPTDLRLRARLRALAAYLRQLQ